MDKHTSLIRLIQSSVPDFFVVVYNLENKTFLTTSSCQKQPMTLILYL